MTVTVKYNCRGVVWNFHISQIKSFIPNKTCIVSRKVMSGESDLLLMESLTCLITQPCCFCTLCVTIISIDGQIQQRLKGLTSTLIESGLGVWGDGGELRQTSAYVVKETGSWFRNKSIAWFSYAGSYSLTFSAIHFMPFGCSTWTEMIKRRRRMCE